GFAAARRVAVLVLAALPGALARASEGGIAAVGLVQDAGGAAALAVVEVAVEVAAHFLVRAAVRLGAAALARAVGAAGRGRPRRIALVVLVVAELGGVGVDGAVVVDAVVAARDAR